MEVDHDSTTQGVKRIVIGGPLNIKNGHAMIGNSFGNNTNASTYYLNNERLTSTTSTTNTTTTGAKKEDPTIKLTEQLSKMKLENKRLIQETEFGRLLAEAKTKIARYERENQDYEFDSHLAFLDEVLDNQEDLTVYHNSPSITAKEIRIRTAQRQLILNKNSLLHILTKEELQKLCELKEAITKLKLQIE
jgi:hypothetical protein